MAGLAEVTIGTGLKYVNTWFQDQMDTLLGNDNTGKDQALIDFQRSGSITKLLKTCIIEPNIIITRNAYNTPILDDLCELNLSIFTSFYIQAFQLLCGLYNAPGVQAVDLLSTNKYSGTKLEGMAFGKYLGNLESFSTKLEYNDMPLTLNQLDFDNVNTFILNTEAKNNKGKKLDVNNNTNWSWVQKAKEIDPDLVGNNDTINTTKIPKDVDTVDLIRMAQDQTIKQKEKDIADLEKDLSDYSIRLQAYRDKVSQQQKTEKDLTDALKEANDKIKDSKDKLSDANDELKYRNNEIRKLKEKNFEEQKAMKAFEAELRKDAEKIKARINVINSVANTQFDNLVAAEINDPKNQSFGGYGRQFKLVLGTTPTTMTNKDGSKDIIGEHKLEIPMAVIASTNVVKEQDIATALETKDFRHTLSYRWREYRSGGISLADFIFCGDLIKEYRASRLKDSAGLLAKLEDQNIIGNVRRGLTGAKGAEGSYNMIIITEDEIEHYNKVLGKNILTPEGKNKFLRSLNGYMFAIVNDDTERVTMHIADLKGSIDMGYNRLQRHAASKNNDMMDFMQYLMKNQLPVI